MGILRRIGQFLSGGYRYRLAHPCATAGECRRVAAWARDRGWARMAKRWNDRADRWQSECDRQGGEDPCP